MKEAYIMKGFNNWKINFFMTEAVIYTNQSIDLLYKSMDWFLYDNGLRHERAKLLLVPSQNRPL